MWRRFCCRQTDVSSFSQFKEGRTAGIQRLRKTLRDIFSALQLMLLVLLPRQASVNAECLNRQDRRLASV